MELNKCSIIYDNGVPHQFEFECVDGDDFYTVVDKHQLGVEIAKKILIEKIKNEECFIYSKDLVSMLVEVEKITNEIRNEIMEFAKEKLEEYMDYEQYD